MFSETAVNQIDSTVTTNDETTTTKLFPKVSSKSIVVEIKPRKTMNINLDLSSVETGRLMKLLIEHKEAFSWDYMDMKGISLELCTHHIYIKEYCYTSKLLSVALSLSIVVSVTSSLQLSQVLQIDH